jgi:hypothetical protein
MKTFGHRYWQNYEYRYASSGPDYHGEWSGELIFHDDKAWSGGRSDEALVNAWLQRAEVGETFEIGEGDDRQVFRRID